jgi:alpha-N-arabinofuranosidase
VLQALILTEEGSDRMLLTPTYHIFEMYKVHQDATLLPLDLSCEEYAYGDYSMPSLSASASKDASGRVHLSLCNLNPNASADVMCELRGMALSAAAGRVLTADRMQAHNTFDAPEHVRPADFRTVTVQDNRVTFSLPPMSATVLELS